MAVLGKRKRGQASREELNVTVSQQYDLSPSTMNGSTTALGKRQRKQVSYAEPDTYDSDKGAEEDQDEEETMTEDDDSDDPTFGSRKRRHTPKRMAKKAKLAAARSRKQRPQKPFPFLALPAELRDYIYELALTQKDGITLVSTTKAKRRVVIRGEISTRSDCFHWDGNYRNDGLPIPAQDNSLSPNLLAVNKQIHAEAVAWLYQQPLILRDTNALFIFLAQIGPSNRQVVSEIIVKGWGGGRGTQRAMNVAALVSLADCANLKQLRLDCDIRWFRRPKSLAGQLYRDGHFFFERFGAGRGRKDAALEVVQLSDGNFDTSAYWTHNEVKSAKEIEQTKTAFRAEMSKLLGC